MKIDLITTVQFVLGTLWLASRGALSQVDEESGLPGAQFEFKVDIPPGASDCFFQRIKNGAQFHVSFEVLRGADRNVDVYIKRPDGMVLEQHLWTSRGTTDKVVQWEGDYAICIDNGFSRFSAKLVYLFISTYIEKDWSEFMGEMHLLDESFEKTQRAVDGVRGRVATMAHQMGLGRVRSGKDYYVALTNNSTIQNMSILMICIFVMTSAIQVYFVKNMFKTQKVTPTQKPRA